MIGRVSEHLRGLPAGFRVSTPLIVATAAIGLSAFVATTAVGRLLGAAFTSSVSEEAADPLAKLAKESDDFLETSRKRFDGRSIYSLPPAPIRKPVVTEAPKPPEPPKPPPGPPPPPAVYSGPSPTSVFGDIVQFGSMRVKLGESSDGLKVTAINAPYTITVEHMRGTYTVPLFSKIDERLLKPSTFLGLPSGIKVESGAAGGPAPAGTNGPGPAAVMQGPGAGAAGPVSGGTQPPGAPSAVGAPSAPGVAGSPSNPGGPGAPTAPGAVTAPIPGGTPGAPSQLPGSAPATVPNGLPSPAMQPQQVPPPSEPASSGEGVEYVDRQLLPPPRSDEQIRAMSRSEAERAIRQIDSVAGWNVDNHNRARLNHEREQLRLRLLNGS